MKVRKIVYGWLLLVLMLCVLPTSTSIQPNIPNIDKLVHVLMYFFPAYLLSMAARINWKWIIGLIAFGLMIEFIQSFLTYRSSDLYDVCANVLGVLIGWIVGVFIHNRLRSD